MAARSIGSLTVSFGLVAIPVKLYSATQTANAISFNLLHKTCGSRVRQQYICLKEGVVVERDDMVKGYEFAKDQYVQFTPEEIKALEEVGHALGGHLRVRTDRVDRSGLLRQDLLPRTRQGRRQTLRIAHRGAQAGQALRRRPLGCARQGVMVILRPVGDVLAMQQLHFAAEVRSCQRYRSTQDGSQASGAEARPAAHQPADRREVRLRAPTRMSCTARIQAAIQKKVEGQEISVSEIAPPKAAARSSTSWKRCAPAWKRPRARRAQVEPPGTAQGAKRVEEPAKAARKAAKRKAKGKR